MSGPFSKAWWRRLLGFTAAPRLTVTLTLDLTAVSAAMAEASALADAAHLSAEGVGRFLRLLDAGDQLFTLDTKGLAAGGTGDLVVRAQPSDLLLDLVTALRAGDADLGAFEHRLHQASPAVGGRVIRNPKDTIPESGAGRRGSPPPGSSAPP